VEEVEPFHPDQLRPAKTSESRGTEAILNAVVLVGDAETHALPTRVWRSTTCGRCR
jgi:hypothetical protein